MMGQRYGILVSMVVFYGRKVAACSLQNFCIHFAVLLHICCSVTAKLLQYYCKYMCSATAKSMQCLCSGKCLCINSEWGDSAICHSPRRWHISTPAASISAPIGGLRFASLRVISSICGKSWNNRFIIRPHTCSNSLEGMSISAFTAVCTSACSRCRLRRPFLPSRRISTCRRRLTVTHCLPRFLFATP